MANFVMLTAGFPRLQGKIYVRGDSKVFRFQNGKSESLFLQRKNPRRIAWTVLYRRQHRKGISEVRFRDTLSQNLPPPSDAPRKRPKRGRGDCGSGRLAARDADEPRD